MANKSNKGGYRIEEVFWQYYTLSPKVKLCPFMIAKKDKEGNCNYFCGKNEKIGKLAYCVWWTRYLKRALLEEMDEPAEKLRKRCTFDYTEHQYLKMVEAYWARAHRHKGWREEFKKKIFKADKIFREQESNFFSNYRKYMR